jgi:pimeloyl-ACP methyl ester carboxylesterase
MMNQEILCVGSGATRVLVLHGWTLDSSVWGWAMPQVDEERFTYAALDFPGYGRAAQEPPADGVTAMAEAALAGVDALGWDSFSVLGHSMGGTTALRLAGLAPSRVDRVCALAPIGARGYPLDDDSYRGFEAAWPDVDWILRFASPDLEDDTVLRLAELSAGTLAKPTWDRYLANWTGADFAVALNRDVPTTFVLGERDPIATADHLAPTIAALPDATVVTLPGVAHFPMVEQPRAAVAAWERALAGRALAGRAS